MKMVWRSRGRRRSASAVDGADLKIYVQFLLGFLLIFAARISLGDTNPGDVTAINNLYVALGSPVLPGWVASGGDPCGGSWQGVICNNTNIKSITINGANLGGELGDSLGTFASIRTIDLSNNRIGGSIPSNLPATMQNLFLSGNQFTGSIPSSVSSLTELSAMSLNNNLLSGEIPDAFQSLTGLINFDLFSNNLSGHLPPSMGNLSSLTTLHIQNNQLSGTLDVLQDLPLRDLNVENNLFSGPIPYKLLSIPTFRKDGNPFNNSSDTPLPSPSTPTPPSSGTPFFGGGPPSSTKAPPKPADGPSATEQSKSGSSKKSSTKRIVWITIAVVLSFMILALAVALSISACTRRRHEVDRIPKRHDIGAYNGKRENPRENPSLVLPLSHADKVPRETAVKLSEDHQPESRKVWAVPRTQNERERNAQRTGLMPDGVDQEIDVSALDVYLIPPPPPPLPPPPPPPPPPEIIVKPAVPEETEATKPSTRTRIPLVSAKSFNIASLQQFTNSFSQENLIGSGMLGSVYRAELPDGKLLAVKKLDKRASSQQKDVEFLELVNNIDKIRHANVVELMGYCAEHGERLLIYEYCSCGTLQDALHSDDDLKKNLSWNFRIRMALDTARALEYLHEVCEPPIVHRNFKSSNILLDDDLSVHVSECGLAALISSGSVSQLSGQLLSTYGYGAPEFESGIYTIRSDVYSFGVVMLELLTGRKSYDRSRNRGEQFLVRWAIPQLHDIDALSRMVDPSVKGQYSAKSLSRFADIISRCVQSEPEFRPSMSEVVQDLSDMIRRDPSP
ncbi:protein STRUBBELIG-RECEPTOR FAMILY 3-like [Syzygium oleosum]|uniref:protein STRUBBELIG-RECEPTOR FAMILY 3-like n=1 Tax=Syzygium oleosum TaxID=219896 RepID=UPI0011D29CBE|nr:protein STRUBBELIG-RECEPTOR FAMILY 3-like [Syzygium oleosum]